MSKNFTSVLIKLIPLLVFLFLWELYARSSDRAQFLFGSPSSILNVLYIHLANGELLYHIGITAFEAAVGFILGVTIGSAIGFALLYFPGVANLAQPYVTALGAVPIFALAPMMIIWFGIGLPMKMAMAFFATVLVAMQQAYQGGKAVDRDLLMLFTLNGASSRQTFWKFILPSSLTWVFSSLRLNIGLALLGAFIGEFIASEMGLGYIILKAGGVYDIPYVLAALLCIMALALTFDFLVSLLEKRKRKVVELLTVPVILRRLK